VDPDFRRDDGVMRRRDNGVAISRDEGKELDSGLRRNDKWEIGFRPPPE
jgi:hypothetical protein